MASSKLGPSPSTYTPSEDSATDDLRQQLVHKLLMACPELVFEPTCPLNPDARLRMIEQLRVGLEGQVAERRSEGKSKPRNSQDEQQRGEG